MTTETQLEIPKVARLDLEQEDDLEFRDIPPFPTELHTAPLLRISLRKLLSGDEQEVDRLWKACCELGFFYLDLRQNANTNGVKSPEHEKLVENVWKEHASGNSDVGQSANCHDSSQEEVGIDGERLLQDARELFAVGQGFFELPVEEKVKYDFKAEGSYFGYKGYGDGVIDAKGTKDRNEFYNVSKDDILGLSDPIPAPEMLKPRRPLLKSYIQQSHSIVTLLLRLLNSRLDLPADRLPSLHRLHATSGDQVRWVYAPPQPFDDRKQALGEHTDFGSITILFNRLGGLQVLPPQTNDWCYVKPLAGHAVVNIGDAMVKFTAGILRSNIHRVVSPPGEQADSTRMSLVYFARPEDDVILKVLDGSKLIDEKKNTSKEYSAEQEEVTAKDWILRRALGRRTGGNWEKSAGTEANRIKN